MVVRTHRSGCKVTGVEVDAIHVRRYFPRDTVEIELLLDHLQIQLGLSPDFWDGNSEIRDPRLCAWLESKNFHGRPGDAPIPLSLIPSGMNCFRLQPIAAGPKPISVRRAPQPQMAVHNAA